MNRLILLKGATPLFFIALALLYFAVLQKAQAVIPPPDGGYPGFNTAEGQKALFSRTTGVANTAVGWYSLFSNTDGSYNTGVGSGTLLFNVGDQTTGDGTQNTAIGTAALLSNTTGGFNTAIGAQALVNSTTGGFNTAIGAQALVNNTTNAFNTAVGYQALFVNTTGGHNTALGYGAGLNITGDNNVCIGANVYGTIAVDNTTWIGNVNTLTQNFSAGVNDYVTVRLSDGRLGHTAVVSSQRYKEDIKPLAAASEALYALKPVSFRLKEQFDPTRALGFGLIAEEVEKVDPALVYRNDKGQVESVRYEMVNAMLLNEFLKEHRKVQEQESTIAQLKKEMETVAARLKEDDLRIQAVSARIEVSKAVGQTALNKP